jgi:hypothetical protein
MEILVVFAEVARHREEHGTGPAGAQMRERAAHVVGNEFGAIDFPDPLRHRLEGLCDVVVRMTFGSRAHALGDHEQRRGILPGLRDGPVGHLYAGGVQVGHHGADADPAAASHPRVGIGHCHRKSLLAHHEKLHVLFPEGVVDVARGKAAHPRDAFGFQDACNAVGRLDLHCHLLQGGRYTPASIDRSPAGRRDTPPGTGLRADAIRRLQWQRIGQHSHNPTSIAEAAWHSSQRTKTSRPDGKSVR